MCSDLRRLKDRQCFHSHFEGSMEDRGEPSGLKMVLEEQVHQPGHKLLIQRNFIQIGPFMHGGSQGLINLHLAQSCFTSTVTSDSGSRIRVGY